MKNFFTLIILNGACALALANSDSGHHEDLIPWTTVFYQTINVTMLLAGLIYFGRKPITAFFKGKKDSFIAASEKSASVRKTAEHTQMEIKVRLTKLESTADESIARAKAEAADIRKALLAEAEALSKRIQKEAEAAAKLEIAKAKNSLRQQLLQESVESSRNNLAAKVSSADHQRLQGDFIDNIEAVQP